MNKHTLAALKGSILKWKKIVAGTSFDSGGSNCPLCLLFAQRQLSCSGCPVYEKTGEAECRDTPYKRWQSAGGYYRTANTAALKAAARAELRFLQSLLPKPKPKKRRTA